MNRIATGEPVKEPDTSSVNPVPHAVLFFLIIFSYYIAKPVRNSLFLEWMGPHELPFVYLASAVLTLIASIILHSQLRKRSPFPVITAGIIFFAGGFILLRMLFIWMSIKAAAISFVLYLFISLFAVVSVSLFWALCNAVHAAADARKHYNIIGTGGILGGLAGGAAANILVRQLGTEQLLLVSAALLLAALPLVVMIGSSAPRPTLRQGSTASPAAAEPRGSFKALAGNRALLFIAALVLLSTFIGSLMDYRFQSVIKTASFIKNDRTAYFARIFTMINIGGIIIHTLFTRLVLSRGGAAIGVLPAAVIAVAGSIVIQLRPHLSSVTVIWVLYGAFAYSMVQVSRETLYCGVPQKLRAVAKFYIDSFLFRLGDASAALFILFSNTFFGEPETVRFGMRTLLCGIWVAVIILLYRWSRTDGTHTASDTAT